MSRTAARRRLIFPLDVDTVREAEQLVRALVEEVGLFKIGKQLFVHAGPDIVRGVQKSGGAVFLDLKFHDIPRTVALAGVEAARLGVRMFDVHASGGQEMMRIAATEVAAVCRRERLGRPLMLGVTVLTSMVEADLRQVGVADQVARQVGRLARLARASGCDGVVASPREVKAIRRTCGPGFLIVTPGVRQPGDARDDQKRVETPEAAVRAGADYLVVGKPIRDAADPVMAARGFVAAIARGLGAANAHGLGAASSRGLGAARARGLGAARSRKPAAR